MKTSQPSLKISPLPIPPNSSILPRSHEAHSITSISIIFRTPLDSQPSLLQQGRKLCSRYFAVITRYQQKTPLHPTPHPTPHPHPSPLPGFFSRFKTKNSFFFSRHGFEPKPSHGPFSILEKKKNCSAKDPINSDQ